jgi:hypothetical protein
MPGFSERRLAEARQILRYSGCFHPKKNFNACFQCRLGGARMNYYWQLLANVGLLLIGPIIVLVVVFWDR